MPAVCRLPLLDQLMTLCPHRTCSLSASGLCESHSLPLSSPAAHVVQSSSGWSCCRVVLGHTALLSLPPMLLITSACRVERHTRRIVCDCHSRMCTFAGVLSVGILSANRRNLPAWERWPLFLPSSAVCSSAPKLASVTDSSTAL